MAAVEGITVAVATVIEGNTVAVEGMEWSCLFKPRVTG
jgi:hypothetical protein